MESTIRIIGTGHMAFHLSRLFVHEDRRVLLYGRDASRVVARALEWGCIYGGVIHDVQPTDDLTFLAVADDAIAEVSQSLHADVRLVHLSGMTALDTLHQTEAAVCWPLQSMHSNNVIEYDRIPWFIEAKQVEMTERLEHLFRQRSSSVHRLSTPDRILAHTAAVFANNFGNHLIGKAGQILDRLHIPRSVLWPILDLNMRSIHEHRAEDIQTGPARRGDLHTIDKQRAALKDQPELSAMYEHLTNSILKDYHP